jgi:hypothetical protein
MAIPAAASAAITVTALVEDATPDSQRVVRGPEQERRERCQQRGAPDAQRPVRGEVADYLSGPHAEADQRHLAQVEFGQQDAEICRERVEVVSGARPA